MNKLTKKHISWDANIMSVRVAAETISNSVADSLQLLLNKKINGFEGCKPTIEYIRCFNDLFDVMNSKYENAIGLKKPINEENIESIISYIQALRTSKN